MPGQHEKEMQYSVPVGEASNWIREKNITAEWLFRCFAAQSFFFFFVVCFCFFSYWREHCEIPNQTKRNKELWRKDESREQKSYIMVRSKAALILQSQDFVQGKELFFFFFLEYLIDVEGLQLSGSIGKLNKSPKPWICCFPCLSCLLLDSFLIQHSPLTVDCSSRAS